jgi:formamidopyrimidine-DNA glycosylase
MLHLGMSGSLRVLPADTPRKLHDHLDLVLDSATRCASTTRAASARCTTWSATRRPAPAARAARARAFRRRVRRRLPVGRTRGRRVAIKQLIMNSQRWSSASATSTPARRCSAPASARADRPRGLKRDEVARLVAAIREVLAMAVEVGGTTLRDYVGADGTPGYFRQKLFVYERPDEPCRVCATPVRHVVQGQRSTYWCAGCQH